MTKTLDTILLLALPASGKSEVRKYLANLSEKECREDFHMGPTVQLDDFPYVHFMRCIDDELKKKNATPCFFASGDKPFINPLDWGTLIALVNEDHADLLAQKTYHPKSAAVYMMDRIEAAAKSVGAPARLSNIDPKIKMAVADALEKEAQSMLEEKNTNSKQDLKGKTVVIEFARGGKHGSTMPLSAPFGYQYSLAQLSDAILSRSKILYIWVTPEESRRKNTERTDPNDPGSILNHGVPIDVMMNDYGCDDMEYLEKNSAKPGTVTVKAHGKQYFLPIARFDNRKDKTTFIRKNKKDWQPEEVKAVHEGLKAGLTRLSQA